MGYKIVLVNSNPATIMTDPNMADVTYIEPLNEYALTEIIKKEKPDVFLPNPEGQTGLNSSSLLAKQSILGKYNVKITGVNIDAIGRMPGWIANFKEIHDAKDNRIFQSRQVYIGRTLAHYTPFRERA
jgi:citrate synthase